MIDARRRTAFALLAVLAAPLAAYAGGGGNDGHHPQQHQHDAPATDNVVKLAPDDRIEIKIGAGERAAVLTEMRGFLESVHGIVAGLAAGKPKVAAEAAKSSGMGATHGMPKSLMGKLPMEFRKLGMDTHQKFDALALEGQGIGDSAVILGQLDSLLANCNACHAGYRFTGE